MTRSEHGIYSMVRSALERAEKHGFDVRWVSDGWTVENDKISVRGSTATELHQYLNGYEDGAAGKAERERNENPKAARLAHDAEQEDHHE